MTSSSSYQDGVDPTRLLALIGSNIQKVHKNVSLMQRNIALLGTDQDTERVREEITQTGHTSKELVANANMMLKQLTLHVQNSPTVTAEQKQQRVQTVRPHRQLTVAGTSTQRPDCRDEQSAVGAACRRRQGEGVHCEGARTAAGRRAGESVRHGRRQWATDVRSVRLLCSTSTTSYNCSIPAMARTQIQTQVDMATMREREQAVQQLETDIVDLNHIFKDLAVMVHEQGDMVDSIADNVERASVQVEAGASQISQALVYQVCLTNSQLTIIRSVRRARRSCAWPCSSRWSS